MKEGNTEVALHTHRECKQYAYFFFAGKSEETIGTLRLTYEDIKMGLNEKNERPLIEFIIFIFHLIKDNIQWRTLLNTIVGRTSPS